MKTLTAMIAAAGLALSMGCTQDTSESSATKKADTEAPAQADPATKKADTEAPAQANPTESAEVDDIAIADDELPVAADFEEEADSEINDDNYASILDELEGEIAEE